VAHVATGEESCSASVRTATPDDLARLRDIYRRSSLSNADDREVLLGSPEALEWEGGGIATGRTRVAVDEAGRAVGFATAVPLGVGLELEDLFVDPDLMRRGIATRLMSVLVEEAARAGAPWIEVTANPHAARFYASAGFVPVGTVRTRFGDAPRLRLHLGRTAP
jgi:GNAT superfamily N-acetyltransferase